MSHHKTLRDGIKFVIPETESAVVVVWYERRGQTWRRNGGLDMCLVWRCSSNSESARGSYNTGQWLRRRGRFSDLSKCMTQMLFLCCWTVPVEGSHRSFVSIATHVNDIADFKPLIIWRLCCCAAETMCCVFSGTTRIFEDMRHEFTKLELLARISQVPDISHLWWGNSPLTAIIKEKIVLRIDAPEKKSSESLNWTIWTTSRKHSFAS